MPLFPALHDPPPRQAIRFGERTLDYPALRGAVAAVAAQVRGAERVAVWAEPTLETALAILGGLAAGVPVVPLNPKSGSRELAHILADSAPDAVFGATLEGVRRLDADPDARGNAAELPAEPDPEHPALVVYTSGTTGPPKGALLPRRALASNLDALADAWAWSADDVLVHGLPLFHVHGLVLGTLGPVRLGGGLVHLGRFSPVGAAEALRGAGTMLFGVPTMYGRLAEEAERDPAIADGLRAARILVSGSAALPASQHARFERITGQRIVERYGMTETLMNCAVRADGDRRPGAVGPPLDGVELRLLDDDGEILGAADDETVGEIAVRGPNLFLGYLNRPDATEAAMRDGWFVTGDMGTRAADGYVRIVGRRATDLIKSGGYKIGAGEIESALLEHPAIAEAAVTGAPDEDLGERVVAWVVVAEGRDVAPEEVSEHVARLLTPHKRPRDVRYLEALPRNAMGKVVKAQLPSR